MRAASRGLGAGCGVTDGADGGAASFAAGFAAAGASARAAGARSARSSSSSRSAPFAADALPMAAAAGIVSDGRLPSAARAASALVTAFSTVSGDVPFSRCLRITSWRCLSRRRSSRHAPIALTRSLTARRA